MPWLTVGLRGCGLVKIALLPALPIVPLFNWRRLSDGLNALKEFVLRAAPKQKRSKGRRDIRFKSFALKNRRDIVRCPVCEDHKLKDHLCMTCYARYRQYVKEQTGRLPIVNSE